MPRHYHAQDHAHLFCFSEYLHSLKACLNSFFSIGTLHWEGEFFFFFFQLASLQVGKISARAEVNATEWAYKSKWGNIISELADTYACGYFSPTQLDHDKLLPFNGASDYSVTSLWMLSGYKESAEILKYQSVPFKTQKYKEVCT